MAQVLPSLLRRPVHPKGDVSLVGQLRTPIRFASSLTENFGDNARDPAVWTEDQFAGGVVTGVTVAETSGQLRVTGPASVAAVRYSGYVSVNLFSLNCIYVALVHTSMQSSEVVYLNAGHDNVNYYGALLDSGTLYFVKRVAGAQTILTTVGAWSATTHKWLRLRWGGSGDNTVYLDTATSSASDPPVSSDWTNRASGARDSAVNLAACRLAIGGGLYASIASPTTFIFDGFNTATTSATAYTLTADSAAFTLTGTATTLKAARLLTADSASFALSGTAVALKVTMPAASGAFTLSGTAATLTVQRKLTAASASYTLNGTAVTLKRGLVLTAASGSYALSGTAVSLKAARLLAAASGSYSLSGTAATFKRGLILAAQGGAYTLAGSDAGLRAGRLLTAGSGAYVLTGSDATLILTPAITDHVMTAQTGTYTLTAREAQLVREGPFKFWRQPPLIGRRTSPGRSR